MKRIYKPKIWTEEVVSYLKKIASGRSEKQIQKMLFEKFGLDLTLLSISCAKHKFNAKSNINTGRFVKGSIPANKGKKMSAEQYEKCKATMFKKDDSSFNNANFNLAAVGTESVVKGGYIKVKIGMPNKWKLKHRLLYEQVFGPIPKGHKVVFLDGNIRNFDINNLYLVKDQEEFIANQKGLIYKGCPEATKSGLAVAKVLHKINERKRGKENGN